MKTENQYKVNVCVIAYNHEKYISQCINSLLNQEVSFPFNIIISDDCSTDNTWLIISELAGNHPGKIKAFRQHENIGPFENYLFLHNQATANYVAHIDGDDYALPGKLQRQFEILEGNPDCNVVLHAVDILQKDGRYRLSNQINSSSQFRVFTQADQVNFTWIGAHSSKMYRNGVRKIYVKQKQFIDFFLIFQEIGSGVAIFVSDKAYGVYREGIGLATKGNLSRKLLIKHLIFIYEKFPSYRPYVCSAFFYMLISDIKNKSDTLKLTIRGFFKTIEIRGLFIFIKTLKDRLNIVI
jgi:glycosyltransferase involved in cell wall biosynthesis